MTDRERDMAFVIRKALRKKKAYGLLPIMRSGQMERMFPNAWKTMKRFADRRIGARTQVFVGRNVNGWWVSMTDGILDLNDEQYLQRIHCIIRSNITQGFEEDDEQNDNGD